MKSFSVCFSYLIAMQRDGILQRNNLNLEQVMLFTNHFSEFLYAAPFIGILLSIALGPLLAPNFWHHHYFKIALGWLGVTLVLLGSRFALSEVMQSIIHVMLHEYFPFIILIGVLFVITSGIHITFSGKATPLANTTLLLSGGILASFIGTTGAAMLLIRPIIRLNTYRQNVTHIVVFFIFIVANIGGILTPLGDPPLFLGYLKGIEFWWTFQNLLAPWLVVFLPLLIIFYALDHHYFAKDPKIKVPESKIKEPKVKVTGIINFIPLLGVIVTVWGTGAWSNSPNLGIGDLTVSQVLRELLLIIFGLISWAITPQKIRQNNDFSWEPFLEICRIFVAIFITIIPVVTMLHAGVEGPFQKLLLQANPNGIPNNDFYFWATGLLSALLDNAPTYLVFFHMAGGDPAVLMTSLKGTLIAISCGAVFMGALSYIGNAPNFMVRSIAEKSGVKMPSFFGYIVWSTVILVPLFALLDYLYFVD